MSSVSGRTALTRPPEPRPTHHAPTTRLHVRRVATSLSLGVVVLYGLIAANVVTVIDAPAEQVARDQLGFALPAAGAYLLGAGLLWWFDRRPITCRDVTSHRRALGSR
jgi:hypothetical protein